MREIWDYIVIGAGPAGSVFCAKAAASPRILRLDGSFRGEKPCGGRPAPQAAEAIASLGWTMPTKVLADPQVFAVRTIDLQAEVVQSYPRSYLNMRRPAFDAWLRGMAGSGVTTIRARATGLRQEADGWAVEFRCPDGSVDTARGRAIVGADGAGSLVRRAVAPGRDILRYTAIQQWFPIEGAAPLYACGISPADERKLFVALYEGRADRVRRGISRPRARGRISRSKSGCSGSGMASRLRRRCGRRPVQVVPAAAAARPLYGPGGGVPAWRGGGADQPELV